MGSDDLRERLPRVMELDFDARFVALQAMDAALQVRGIRVSIVDCDEAVHAFMKAYNDALDRAPSSSEGVGDG